jgi:hypothetical protein
MTTLSNPLAGLNNMIILRQAQPSRGHYRIGGMERVSSPIPCFARQPLPEAARRLFPRIVTCGGARIFLTDENRGSGLAVAAQRDNGPTNKTGSATTIVLDRREEAEW